MRFFETLTVVNYYNLFLAGISITLRIAFLGFGIALVTGLIICFARLSNNSLINTIGNLSIQLSRNTPILVSLVWVFYALPQIIPINYGAMVAAVIAIAIQATGYQSEVYRGGIQSIEEGQMMAAKALGMPYFLAMRRIILPQAFRRIVPPTVNTFSTSLKSTSIVSVIAAPDLMYQAQRLTSQLYKPMEIYTTAAIIYIFLVGFTSYLADWLDRTVKAGESRAEV